MSDNDKKGNSGRVGAVLGAAAGTLGTIMANPLGSWAVFVAQDEMGLRLHNFIEDLFKSRQAGDNAFRIYSIITNTLLNYPALLPIAGGLLAAGVGALVGKKVSKSKLKHQSLKVKSNEKRI